MQTQNIETPENKQLLLKKKEMAQSASIQVFNAQGKAESKRSEYAAPRRAQAQLHSVQLLVKKN
jgi:hypothetical protein